MLREVLTALSACVLLTLGMARAEGGTASAAMDRFVVDLRSLEGPFTQIVFNEDGSPAQRAAGTMQVQRPNRFRWDYAQPQPQEIVSDGERVWFYDPDLAQVTVRMLDKVLGNSPAALLASDRPVREAYAVIDLPPADDIDWVALRPLHAGGDDDFDEIRLGFDGDALARIEMTDAFGHVTRIQFGTLSRNRAIPADQFRFTPPPDVDVVGP